MSNISRALLVALALAVSGGHAQANTVITFPVGSIIIPSSSVFQSDCGAVSMYGLAYDVLRANKWLVANGYGAITLYYAVADGTATSWSPGGKLSPNRCKPTNASVAPAPATDASWNDGCDFQLTSASGTPVKLVSNVATASTSDTVVTTYSTTSKTTVYPQYAAIALNASVTTVGYLGGPLVITATDAVTFLKLVQGTLIAKDTAGNNIDFTPFRTTKPATTGSCTFGVDHYVNLHRAQVAFNASIVRSFSDTPPRLALLDSDNTHVTGVVKSSNATAVTLAASAGATESGLTATFTTTSAHGFAIGNQVTVSGVPVSGYNGTFTVATVPSTTKFTATMSVSNLASSAGGSAILAGGSILIGYLNNAGLTFAGSQGCPTGGQNVGNLALCPLAGNAGQIYDTFDIVDLKNNKLTVADSGIPRYSMIWTPHWETTANATTAPNTTERTALTNIKSFLDGQTGLLGECASITAYEGSYQGGAAKVIGSPTAYGGMQLQTCVNSGGNCSTTTSNFGTDRNVTGAPSGSALRNCSDVTTATGTACVFYGYPQDPFAQLADYEFVPKTGTTQDFHPNTATSTMYRPGVLALISGVNVLDKTKLTSPATARAMIVTDWSTRNIKDNTPGKANIAYLGGHDLTGEVSGTKLVLETLLQLGSSVVVLPTSTIEVSRATPIVAQIDGGETVVQGTFESVTPAPAVTTINAAGDVAAWSFPYQIGHMRATVSSTISVNAAKFGTGTVLFDAAAGIPTVSNGGCATPFTGGCRTVFTTTTVSATGVTRNPANVFFQDSNATALGTLMAPGLAAAQWTVMVEKVLAGHSDGNGNFLARLGGVDRSSVAVIEPSSVIPNARPTMAYFGATDGMMHAVCASLTAPCDVLGRELWAFVPRTQLPFFRTNTTRIDGSPHVADVFGDFTNSGIKSFHTILTFQTGSGNVTIAGSTPSVYALDITDPTHPSVVWEYTIANPSARGTYELGSGLAMAAGSTTAALTRTDIVFAETNNGGTAGAGVVVTAMSTETGAKLWQFGYTYPSPHVNNDLVVPASGIPGGAVAVDKTTQGYVTDVVFADLFGNLWEVDPMTGTNRYPNKPLFQFSTDYHPIGAMPAIYSAGKKQYAVIATGGFDDPADTTWGTATQAVAAVSLSAPVADATLNQLSGPPDVPFMFSLAAGQRTFAQPLIVGGQLFVTTDSADVNTTGYGTNGATGHMISYTLATGASSTVVVTGGAGAVANVGTTLYTASSSQQQQISTSALTTTGESVDGGAKPQFTKQLYLRRI